MPKARFYWKNNEKSMILHLQSFHFPIKIPFNFQAFSNTLSWTSFFRLWMLSGAKMLDFRTPLAPSWSPNDAQNRPGGAKNAPKTYPGDMRGTDLLSRSLSERSWAPLWLILDAPGPHLGRLGVIFMQNLIQFDIISIVFLHVFLRCDLQVT